MLNKHIVGVDTNFQVVGCTIDAGTKIYAARVDALHQNTYQMLSGLGHEQNGNDQITGNVDELGDDNQLDNGDDADQGKQKTSKNKRRAKKSTQICENLDQINMKNSNCDSLDDNVNDNDIYFTTISTAIEQKAIAGMLNNKLIIENDLSMNLIINKEDLYFDSHDALFERMDDSSRVTVRSLVDFFEAKLKRLTNFKLTEHPYLCTLDFLNWNLDTEDAITDLCETIGNQKDSAYDDLEQHRFDRNLNELDAIRLNEVDQNNSNIDLNGPDVDVDNDEMDVELPAGKYS